MNFNFGHEKSGLYKSASRGLDYPITTNKYSPQNAGIFILILVVILKVSNSLETRIKRKRLFLKCPSKLRLFALFEIWCKDSKNTWIKKNKMWFFCKKNDLARKRHKSWKFWKSCKNFGSKRDYWKTIIIFALLFYGNWKTIIIWRTYKILLLQAVTLRSNIFKIWAFFPVVVQKSFQKKDSLKWLFFFCFYNFFFAKSAIKL